MKIEDIINKKIIEAKDRRDSSMPEGLGYYFWNKTVNKLAEWLKRVKCARSSSG